MSKESTLILLGVLTMLVSFVGLPLLVRTILVVLFGFATVLIGIALKARARSLKKEETVENVPPHDTETSLGA